MNEKKLVKSLGVFALCLICLWAIRENARAAEPMETESPAKEREVSYEKWLRRIMKERGKQVGRSGQCYYTYANHKKEITIIGFRETAREIKIPDKIKGKKVTQIDVERPFSSGDYFKSTNEWYYVKIKPSRTKSIYLSRYIKKIPGSTMQERREEATETLRGERGVLSNLEQIKVSPQNKHFMAKDGVLFSKDGKILREYPDKRKASVYQIPKGVVKLETFAFEDARVKKVIMPDTVKSVGSWCFAVVHAPCYIKSVRLSKKLKKVGEYAFSRTHLQLSLPESLEVIQAYAFSNTGIKKLSLPKHLKFIGRSAFSQTDIREVTIPGNVKKISAECFRSCEKLKKITIKKGVKKIGKRAFENCYQLRRLVIPPSVNHIENPFAIDYHDESGGIERNEEAWHKAGVTIYVKNGSHAYRKFSKKFWKESYGIKVKEM